MPLAKFRSETSKPWVCFRLDDSVLQEQNHKDIVAIIHIAEVSGVIN